MTTFRESVKWYLNEWILPHGVQRLRERWGVKRYLRLSPEEKAVLSRNRKFQNLYSGKRCFIVGNGPSLAKQDLTPLQNEVTIVMNFFNRHPLAKTLRPAAYCAAESGYDIDPDTFCCMLPGVSADAYFFAYDTKSLVQKIGCLPPEKTYYTVMRLPIHEWPSEQLTLDLTKTIPLPQDTSIYAIMIASAFGCTPIFLLGMDYDQLSHLSYQRHFYDANDPEETLLHLGRAGSYGDRIERVGNIWKTHRRLEEIARERHQAIYNATEGGFLDVYPTISLQKALSS